MAVTPKAFARTILTGSSASLYTVPAATYAVITNIVLGNISASPVAATIALDDVVLIPATPIPANSNLTFDLRQYLDTTKVIAGFADTAAVVTCHISGTENT
jgi:hypothetical protein